MHRLNHVITHAQTRAELIQAITALIDRRVSATTGISGMAIRGAYKVVSRMRGGRMVPGAVDYMLDDFVAAIVPLLPGEGASLEAHWRGREREVAAALLSITDRRADKATAVLQKPYRKLRGFGEEQLVLATPELATLLSAYV